MKKIRCAIYTRKSAEEGLEQDFNSLDANSEKPAQRTVRHRSLPNAQFGHRRNVYPSAHCADAAINRNLRVEEAGP